MVEESALDHLMDKIEELKQYFIVVLAQEDEEESLQLNASTVHGAHSSLAIETSGPSAANMEFRKDFTQLQDMLMEANDCVSACV